MRYCGDCTSSVAQKTTTSAGARGSDKFRRLLVVRPASLKPLASEKHRPLVQTAAETEPVAPANDSIFGHTAAPAQYSNVEHSRRNQATNHSSSNAKDRETGSSILLDKEVMRALPLGPSWPSSLEAICQCRRG